MWKTFALAFCLLLSLETGGCVRQEKKSSEQHELEIKIVTEEEIPEELMSLIEKNKKNPFRLTGSSETWAVVYNRGELARASMTINLEEYT